MAKAQTLPSPWASRDIGAPALAGSATYSNGIYRVDAAGEDIWGSSDEFQFVYQAVTGDIDVRARVDSVTAAHAWSKAGLMIRSSLSADAAHGYALVSAGKGVAFQRRLSTAALSAHTSGALVGPPQWVRLVRAGTKVTAMASANGTTWTTIGSDTIALGATAYVGIAATSHHTGMRTTAAVSNVTFTAVSPSAPLPSGQANGDIGSPAVKGSTSYASGRYTISAAGADIWDAADQFHYVYQPVTGNVEVVARVASITPVDVWSKAGVMIRESLSAGSRHAMALTSVSKGYAFQRRPEPNAWSEHTSGGSGTAPGWVRLVRTGTLFEAYRSADGASWTRMGTANIAMGETVYVGIAVTSHNAGSATTAVVDSLKITAGAPTTNNKPPAVILSSPANGTTLTAPATVTVSASASDSDGTVTGVDFYANSTLIGRDTAAPYAATAAGLVAGSYALKAIATDNQGAMTVSDQVTITVTIGAGVVPPTGIAFQKSNDHATLVRKYVLEVRNGSTLVASSDLGKPTPSATGEITVDLTTFFKNLAPGSYTASVLAMADSTSARSEAVGFSR